MHDILGYLLVILTSQTQGALIAPDTFQLGQYDTLSACHARAEALPLKENEYQCVPVSSTMHGHNHISHELNPTSPD
jgi:hypothetical protein